MGDVDEHRDDAWGGKGTFAVRFIPKGTLLWECKIGENALAFTDEASLREYLSHFSYEEQRTIVSHLYCLSQKTILLAKNRSHINHSNTPNAVGCLITGNEYALRDIEKDEELTEDYRTYAYNETLMKLEKEYGIDNSYYDCPREARPPRPFCEIPL